MNRGRAHVILLPAAIAFCMASLGAFGQSDLFEPIREVISAGNSKEMSQYLNQNLDINIEGSVKTYSKAQAEFVFRDFFKKYPPSSFNIVHTGASKGGLQFAIGSYMSGSHNFSVIMRVKKVNADYLMHEISFVKK